LNIRNQPYVQYTCKGTEPHSTAVILLVVMLLELEV